MCGNTPNKAAGMAWLLSLAPTMEPTLLCAAGAWTLQTQFLLLQAASQLGSTSRGPWREMGGGGWRKAQAPSGVLPILSVTHQGPSLWTTLVPPAPCATIRLSVLLEDTWLQARPPLFICVFPTVWYLLPQHKVFCNWKVNIETNTTLEINYTPI